MIGCAARRVEDWIIWMSMLRDAWMLPWWFDPVNNQKLASNMQFSARGENRCE
jgi:hypothetical protein